MQKHYLITAVAGTGKSTVCKKLLKMGYEAYGIEDIDGMFGMYRKDTKELYKDFDNDDPEKIANADWLCNATKLKKVLDAQKKDVAFYCGVASNMDDILPFFDKMFLLVADKDTLYKRLSTREGQDDMGGTEASRQAVLGWKDWWENEMENRGALVIDANGTAKEIAQEIIQQIQKYV